MGNFRRLFHMDILLHMGDENLLKADMDESMGP